MDRFLICRRRLGAALLTLLLLPARPDAGMPAQGVFFSMLFPHLSPFHLWHERPGRMPILTATPDEAERRVRL